MQPDRLRGRLIAAAGVLALLLGGTAPVSAEDPLAQIPFRVGFDGLFEAPSVGSGSTDAGTWSFERGRLANGQVQLHFEIEPPRQTLPVQSGPAVLFASLDLYGDAGGDMGIGMSIPSVARVVIPACADDAACHYSADISIPTKDLADAIARLETEGDLLSIDADMTLVRTFGAGTWLQVLGLHRLEGFGAGEAAGGRLGAMEPTHGLLSQTGLFPAGQAQPVVAGEGNFDHLLDYGSIVERLRKQAGDTSSPIPTMYTDLHVNFVRGCLGWNVLEFHDFDGNLLFYAQELMGKAQINGATQMPVGRPFYVTVDAGEGIRHPVIQVGPIEADGSDDSVVITASMDCATRTGSLRLIGAVGPTPAPTSTPRATSDTAVPIATSAPTDLPAASPDLTPVDDPLLVTLPFVAFGALLLGALVALAAGLLRRRSRPS
jgi:hypothetical protein